MTKQKSFPLEKILTISADDYFLMNGKNPQEYKPVGVHVNGAEYGGEYPTTDTSFTKIFASHVPANAEVVVAYRASAGGTVDAPDGFTVYIAQGTALIPK